MPYFFPVNKDQFDSSEKDKGACLLLENMLYRHQAVPHVQSESSRPNIDGTIVLTDSSGGLVGKVTVQVKSYPVANRGLSKYPIPAYILGYAERIKGEVVLLITADYDEEKIYWKYISEEFIEECANKGLQDTYTYHFTQKETATTQNIDETIETWKLIHEQKANACALRVKDIERRISIMKRAFNSVECGFYGINNSYIEREEVGKIAEWINKPLNSEKANVALLVGEAGCGKSVIMKQLISHLNKEGITYLAIKADMDDPTTFNMDAISECLGHILSYTEKAVILIDQIDALSQALVNDRTALNNYVNLIKEYAQYAVKDVRIIVSCRKFDLEYDPVLNSLQRGIGNKHFLLGKLTEEDVKNVLTKLNVDFTYDAKMIEVLRTPQNLDIYCRIYASDGTCRNYVSQIDLYESLWDVVVYNNPQKKKRIVSSKDLERVIYELVFHMYDNKTLNPILNIHANNQREIKYLASEGVIYKNKNRIKFFHQSFYDFALARYSVFQKKSVVVDLLKGHQGLFIRSQIKFIVDYLRYADSDLYRTDLKLLLSSTTRPHLQIMTLGIIAGNTDILPSEKQIISGLKEKDNSLFWAFVKYSYTKEWFDFLIPLICDNLKHISMSTKEYASYISFLINNMSHSEGRVFDLIEEIEDEPTRKEVARRCLWFANDYQQEKVKRWYRHFNRKLQNEYFYLEKAIGSNVEFVCEEVFGILDALAADVKNKSFNHHHFYDEICKQLVSKCPRNVYPAFKNFLFKAIENNKNDFYHEVLCRDNVFYGSNTDDEYDRIANWIIEILSNCVKTDANFVYAEVQCLLSNKSETTYSIAFDVMRKNPSSFVNELFEILNDNKLTDALLSYGEAQYGFFHFLKSVFPFLTDKQRQDYYDYISKYQSESDFIKRQESYQVLIYPYLGYNKRILLHTIPLADMPRELRIERMILDRRYKKNEVNITKNKHYVAAAHVCGALTSHDRYLHFSKKVWLNSFLNLDTHTRSSKGEYRYLDLRRHADEFTKCVEERIDYFEDFILTILSDNRINIQYLLAGALGMVKASKDNSHKHDVLKWLLARPIDERHYNIYFDIFKVFVDDNDVNATEKIVAYITPIICKVFPSSYSPAIENVPFEDSTNELINKGINSIQGNALRLLIETSHIASFRDRIYQNLFEWKDKLCVELRLTTLYYMYTKDAYDEEKYPQLLSTYLVNNVSEFLIILHDAIHYYWRNQPQIVEPYLRSILHNKRAQKIISQIMFWGTHYEQVQQTSTELLNEIIKDDNIGVVSSLLRQSMKNMEEPQYRPIAETFFRKYMNDNREDVQSTYSLYCDDMPVSQFHLFQEWFCLKGKSIEEKHQHNIFEYLKMCSATKPEQCLICLKEMYSFLHDKYELYQKEYIEILFTIYKYSTELHNSDMMEDIMDIFDHLLLEGNNYEVNKITKAIEYN